MVRVEVIRKRLNRLDEYLSILRNQQRYEVETFLNNPEQYGSTESFLQLAIECGNDLGNHIIADEKL